MHSGQWHQRESGHRKRWEENLGKEELTQMLVELDKGPIIVSPLSKDELIAIVADSTANLGRIRYKVKKNKERLVAAL